MFRYAFLLVATSFVFLLGANQEATAQRVPNYNRRPTVSPYINLFNNNQGGTNNYFSFVRPLQQQAQFQQQQFVENQFLQQQVQRQQFSPLNRQQQGQLQFGGLQPGQGMLRQGNTGIGTPSTAATYFNYSHFYPVPRTTGRRR